MLLLFHSLSWKVIMMLLLLLLLLLMLSFSTILASLMCLHMLREIIRARECFMTVGEATGKWTFHGMNSHMTLQVLQSLKSSLALGDRADMRFLLIITARGWPASRGSIRARWSTIVGTIRIYIRHWGIRHWIISVAAFTLLLMEALLLLYISRGRHSVIHGSFHILIEKWMLICDLMV